MNGEDVRSEGWQDSLYREQEDIELGAAKRKDKKKLRQDVGSKSVVRYYMV